MTTDAADDARDREFVAWVVPHLPAMSRYAGRLVAPADRDDVVQEALVRSRRRWSTYDAARGPALPWLLAVVADRARRHRTRARPASVALADPPADTVANDGGTDIDVDRAVARLSGRQRQAVDLYYFVGLDVATCAEVMGCADGTVKATLHQARARLRVLLGDDFARGA